MDILRKFLSMVHRMEDCSEVPGFYLGHTFALQPSPDELKRASHILIEKNKKDIEKNALPTLHITFEGNSVVMRDGRQAACNEFDVRRIVVSCVDAKNQKLLAIFYHKDNCFGVKVNQHGLECHLFLCRSKDKAKMAAHNIGELLAKEYELPDTRPTARLDESEINFASVVNKQNDFDYENVSKFFRQKFLNEEESSIYSTTCDSLSTFATTTGYDSGRASTITSRDFKNTSHVSDKSAGPSSSTPHHQSNGRVQNRTSVHYDQQHSDTDDSSDDRQFSRENRMHRAADTSERTNKRNVIERPKLPPRISNLDTSHTIRQMREESNNMEKLQNINESDETVDKCTNERLHLQRKPDDNRSANNKYENATTNAKIDRVANKSTSENNNNNSSRKVSRNNRFYNQKESVSSTHKLSVSAPSRQLFTKNDSKAEKFDHHYVNIEPSDYDVLISLNETDI